MKKSILTGVALMAFAAVSFAQNTATLNQVGSHQTSGQTQSGNNLTSTVTQGSGSDATINTYNQSQTDQSGKFQQATVTQAGNADYNQAVVTQTLGGTSNGTANQATITQQNTSGGTSLRSATPGIGTAGTGNYSTILQAGDQNTANVSQSNTSDGNYGSVTQYGTGNTQAEIIQDQNATGNTAKIGQGSSTLNVLGNKALVQQSNTSLYNDASVMQSGNSNTGAIRETSTSKYNVATLMQVGGNNNATIDQNTGSGGSTAALGNTAALYQQGNNNIQTSIEQNGGGMGDSYSNKASLNQYGSNNLVTRISQNNGSYNNTARIDMGGDGPTGTYGAYGFSVNSGTAIVEQNNNSHDNKARIGQSGDLHDARIYQNDNVSSSEAYIDQYPGAAGHNVGLIQQTNSMLSTARITQNAATYVGGPSTGNNRAEIYQGRAGTPSSDNHTTVVQEDGSNISRNEQFGTSNLMQIAQYGNGNLVTGPAGIAHQEGLNNKAYITQTASGGVANTAFLNQNGNNNTATITQVGGVVTP